MATEDRSPHSGAIPLSYLALAPGIGAGHPYPADMVTIGRQPLLVLVGVTGVGKSTTLAALADQGVQFTLLPDRRSLTDDLIITAMQELDGLLRSPVTDRRQRFAYTRRFREMNAGGMADALALLSVSTTNPGTIFVFDGLRGENEVVAACKILPMARFVMLDAPDAVRVVRLLGRSDPFDQIAAFTPGIPPADAPDEALLEAAGLASEDGLKVFHAQERLTLIKLVQEGSVTLVNLRAKIDIVLEERRNYDPAATRSALQQHAGDRALIIDTTRYSATEAATFIARRCTDWWLTQEMPAP